MKHVGKLATAVVAAAVVATLSTGVANAADLEPEARSGSASADGKTTRGATVVVAGGIWSYGVGNGSVVSAYDHKKVTHSTSVKSSGVTKSSGKVAKGKVAFASRPSALFGNQAFWNIY